MKDLLYVVEQYQLYYYFYYCNNRIIVTSKQTARSALETNIKNGHIDGFQVRNQIDISN